MRIHTPIAVLAALLLPALAGGAAGEPPAVESAAEAAAERPAERFAANYELVLEVEQPGSTARQTLLLATPRFQADLGLARFEGKLAPAGRDRVLLDYEVTVQRQAGTEAARSVERLRWRAGVLLAHGVPTAFVATHDTTVRATVRPAP